MTTTHLILRIAHISMGSLALLSGAAAMTFLKGSRMHRRAGNVFTASMLIMAMTGLTIAVFIVPSRGNVMGGLLAFYLTATGWATAWRKPGTTGRLEIATMLLGLTVVALGVTSGIQARMSATGRFDHYPATFYFIFAGAALLGSTFDVRMITRGGIAGAPRLARHLTRTCAAMFMATASFFLGQAKLFPAAVRESGVLRIPVLVVVVALLYWLIRIRLVPVIRRSRARRLAGSLPRG